MKSAQIIAPLILIGLIGVGVAGWLSLETGEPVPAVEMTTLDGERFDLADLDGRPVLVTFWATNCPSCIAEMPQLVELHEDFSDRGFEIIGVAMHHDEPHRVRDLVAQRELPYRIVMDEDKRVMQAFGEVRVTPTNFLISPSGRIVEHHIGELDTADLRRRVERML